MRRKQLLQLGILIVCAVSAPAEVTVTIADQGPEVIHSVTGQRPDTASLISVITCNESAQDDATVSTGRVYRSIEIAGKVSLYSSEVVEAVLAEMQQRDKFARLYRAGKAGATITGVLMAAFQVSPIASTALQVAPPLWQATVGIVRSPRDLLDFSKRILPDNGSITLARSACSASLVVGRSSGGIPTDKFPVE